MVGTEGSSCGVGVISVDECTSSAHSSIIRRVGDWVGFGAAGGCEFGCGENEMEDGAGVCTGVVAGTAGVCEENEGEDDAGAGAGAGSANAGGRGSEENETEDEAGEWSCCLLSLPANSSRSFCSLFRLRTKSSGGSSLIPRYSFTASMARRARYHSIGILSLLSFHIVTACFVLRRIAGSPGFMIDLLIEYPVLICRSPSRERFGSKWRCSPGG
jgi:hypothetical protein